MTKSFKYGILQYCHSPFWDEQLNLGLIFKFEEPSKFIFKFPRNFNRIKKIYKEFDDAIIKQYLIAFENKVQELNEDNFQEDLESTINSYFLVQETSPLQFKMINSVVQYSDDIEKISRQYLQLYFPEITSPDQKKGKNDHQVSNEFKSLLLAKDKSIKKLLAPPLELKNEKAYFKADLVWKNGTVNAVKGVSFDLKESEAVSDKALLINAKLNYLSNDAESRNIRFDLIVKAPTQHSLLPAYENALGILGDIKANLEIITEEKLELYIQRTINEIERNF